MHIIPPPAHLDPAKRELWLSYYIDAVERLAAELATDIGPAPRMEATFDGAHALAVEQGQDVLDRRRPPRLRIVR